MTSMKFAVIPLLLHNIIDNKYQKLLNTNIYTHLLLLFKHKINLFNYLRPIQLVRKHFVDSSPKAQGKVGQPQRP